MFATQEYDASALSHFLGCLTPERMLLLWTSRKWKGSTDCKEPWYGADYSIQPLPQELLEQVRQYVAVESATAAAAATGGEAAPTTGELRSSQWV
jgi:insulysin